MTSMIVVMGVTGAGKSYFINQVVGRKVTAESDSLDSCTQICNLIPAQIGQKKVLLLDTPGFDDSTRSDADVLKEIAQVLAARYQLGVPLKGIIYIHRITDVRYSASAVRTFEIFKSICGTAALENVLLVTSRWDAIEATKVVVREIQMEEIYWANVLSHGARMSRFYGNHESAISLINRLLFKDSAVLELQRELVDQDKRLGQTGAGSYICDMHIKLQEQYEYEHASTSLLKQQLQGLEQNVEQHVLDEWDVEKARLRKEADDEFERAMLWCVRDGTPYYHKLLGGEPSQQSPRVIGIEADQSNDLRPVVSRMGSFELFHKELGVHKSMSLDRGADSGPSSMTEVIGQTRGETDDRASSHVPTIVRPESQNRPRQEEGYVFRQSDKDAKPLHKAQGQSESVFTRAKESLKLMAENQRDGAQYRPSRSSPTEDKTARYRRERDEARDGMALATDRVRELEKWREQDGVVTGHYVRQLEAQSEEHKKAIDAMQRHMENEKLYWGHQLADHEVILEYDRILNDIASWSCSFNAGTDNDSMFVNQGIQSYRVVAPMCSSTRDLAKFVSNKADKRLFVRGWVAYVMTKRFFRTLDIESLREKDLWMDGTLSAASKQLEDAFWSAGRASIPYRAFNDWRALSTELLARLPIGQLSQEQLEVEVREAVKVVMHLVYPWEKPSRAARAGEAEPQTPENVLAGIFHRAVQFAGVLRRQRAMWNFRFQFGSTSQPDDLSSGRAPLPFDITCMEDKSHREEDMSPEQLRRTSVAVVIAPALCKRGTIQGTRYESEEVTMKALVSVNS